MKDKTIIPKSIAGFTEYIRMAYDAARVNMIAFNINAAEFAKITPLYDSFIRAEALCAYRATATAGSRVARKTAWRALEKHWRVFLNREVRINEAISTGDRLIFGLLPHDGIRTRAGVPSSVGRLVATRMSRCLFDVVVNEETVGRRKRPEHAAGSNLYSAVVDVRQPAPPMDTFHYEGFSSVCRHRVNFPEEYYAKQAYLFARYVNGHGEEGPAGPLMMILVS
ncbi:MAG: hypothetical protein LBJ47_10050 [Tannerella sp.]|nr:hypothetical protein [Tannerella sp.]